MICQSCQHSNIENNMKLTIYVLLLTPMISKAQWGFNVINDGSTSLNADLLFPITYSHNDCQFDFTVFNNGSVDDVSIYNNLGCTADNHFLVIDELMYQLNDTMTLDIYSDVFMFSGSSKLFGCATISGSSIIVSNPYLSIDGQNISFSSTNDVEIFYDSKNMYFKFDSANGDVVCDNSIPYVDPSDVIFKGGFE